LSELSALEAIQRELVPIAHSNEMAVVTAADQIVVNGLLDSGAVLSLHMRGGQSSGTNLVWKINGTEADLSITCDSGFVHLGPLQCS
jgi:hypothetical protein